MKSIEINRNIAETAISRMGQDASELQGAFQHKHYQNLPVWLQKHFRQSSKLSDGSVLCWQALHELSLFDENWSVQISISGLSKEIGKRPRTTIRLLKELEDNGYLSRETIKKDGVNLATRMYVRLPRDVLDQLKAQSDRASSIEKCGTIYQTGCAKNGVGGYAKNGASNNNIYNKYNNNTNRDLASDKIQKNSESNSNLSVVDDEILASETSTPDETSSSLPQASISCSSNSVSSVEDDVEINFFASEGGDVVDPQKQSAERAKIQQDITNWQKELDCLPSINDAEDNAAKYSLLKRSNTLDVWISQSQNKLEQLDKPVKRDHLKLANGERRLTQDHCDKINKVLLQSYKDNKITAPEGRKTARSMVNAILHGYYRHQKVEIKKSLNSVILKFKRNEWNNSEVDRDKPSRPQPDWFDASKYRNNKINFSEVVKSVN